MLSETELLKAIADAEAREKAAEAALLALESRHAGLPLQENARIEYAQAIGFTAGLRSVLKASA